MKRAEILAQVKEAVCKDRQETYGTPENSFGMIALLWDLFLKEIKYKDEGHTSLHAQDVAILMALLKIARLAKSPGHLDNWSDLAGYAVCGGEIATAEQEGLQGCNSEETTDIRRGDSTPLDQSEWIEASLLSHQLLQIEWPYSPNEKRLMMDAILRPTTMYWRELNQLRNLAKQIK